MITALESLAGEEDSMCSQELNLILESQRDGPESPSTALTHHCRKSRWGRGYGPPICLPSFKSLPWVSAAAVVPEHQLGFRRNQRDSRCNPECLSYRVRAPQHGKLSYSIGATGFKPALPGSTEFSAAS